MNAQTERFSIRGLAGSIEALRDEAMLANGVSARGVAVIAHPHPLYAGTMDNKVVQTLARAFVQCGWHAVRFNFRGVGASGGAYDEGRGELQDMLAVVAHSAPQGELALSGFSFGAFVASHAIRDLWPTRPASKVVLVGTAASRFDVAAIPEDAHDRTLVVHAEQDDTVPLADVMNWARPQSLPLMVVPGGSHFFHGQLGLLKNMVVRHLQSP